MIILLQSRIIGLTLLCHTFRLEEDTAWHPVWKEEFEKAPILRKAITFGYGPFRPWMSIAHWYV